MFDDFDTQVQSDEIIPEEYDDWVATLDSPWKAYEVDCDDGTQGDIVYEWVG